MKKTYEKPQVDVISFEPIESFADGSGVINPPQGLNVVGDWFETKDDMLIEF